MLRKCKGFTSVQDFICPFMKHTRIVMKKDKSNFIIQCCVCKKIRRGDNWVLPPHLLYSLADNVSHGLCPPCYAAELLKVDEWVTKKERKKTKKKNKRF